MTAPLPPPVAQYFEAFAAGDFGALADTFADDATLVDEGRERTGRIAIRAWEEDQLARERRRVEVLTATHGGERVAVMGRVHGNDDLGAPRELRFVFTVAAGKIVRLEIGRIG